MLILSLEQPQSCFYTMWLAQVEMKVGVGYVSRPSALVCELIEGPLLYSFEHMPEGSCARPVRPMGVFLGPYGFFADVFIWKRGSS